MDSITTYNAFKSDDRNNNYALRLPTDDEVWRAVIDQDEFNQEFKFKYDSEDLVGVIGLYYADFDELNTRDGIGLVGFVTPFGVQDVDIDFYNPTKIKTKALFSEFDYNFSDRLTLTAGFRYEKLDFDLTTDGLITLQPSGFPFQDLVLTGDKGQSVFLPKLALNYKLTQGQHIGFTYAEGYRPGGVDLDIFGGSGVTEYDSEYTNNYELSYKAFLLDNRLTVNANAFYVDWKDMQTSGSAQIRSGTFNAGEATVYGMELELKYQPTDNLDGYFNLGYSKTEFDNFVTAGGGNDFTGNRFSNSPRFTAALGGYYDMESWRFGIESSYRDSYYDDITNTYEVGSLTLVNASVSYRLDKVQIRVYADNLFDKIQLSRNTFSITDPGATEPQITGLLSEERTVGVRVSYQF